MSNGRKVKKENIRWDNNKKRIVITKEEEVDLKGKDINDVRKKLRKELEKIVSEVKHKKTRAEKIKDLLIKLNKRDQQGV